MCLYIYIYVHLSSNFVIEHFRSTDFHTVLCVYIYITFLYKIIWLNTDLKCLIGEGTQSMKHNNNHNFKLYSTL